MDFMYYSYCGKFTGWEFFVPAQTLIGVKLLITFPNFVLSQRLIAGNVQSFSAQIMVSHIFTQLFASMS